MKDFWNQLRTFTLGAPAATSVKVDWPDETPRITPTPVTIANTDVIRILALIGLGVLGWQMVSLLQDLLIMLVVVGFFALGLTPVLTGIERFLPRWMAILLVYLLSAGAFTIFFIAVAPILIEQGTQLVQTGLEFLRADTWNWGMLEGYIDPEIISIEEIQTLATQHVGSLAEGMQSLAGASAGVVTSVFSSFSTIMFGLGLLFFVLLERETVGGFILQLLPQRYQKAMHQESAAIQQNIGAWFTGQLQLMLSVGLGVYIGMLILHYTVGMPYPLTIALVAGFMELFPYIGLALTQVLVALVGLNISWIVALLGVGVVAVVQMLEGNLLVPLIMKENTGMSSVAVILSLSVGTILGNTLGGPALAILFLILSIPITASLGALIRTIQQHHAAESAQKTTAPTDQESA